jgi:hypothetical protein
MMMAKISGRARPGSAGWLQIVFPLMLVEFAIGRRGRSDAADAIARVAGEVGGSRLWALVGLMGVIAAFLIFFHSSLTRVSGALRCRPSLSWQGTRRCSHRS